MASPLCYTSHSWYQAIIYPQTDKKKRPLGLGMGCPVWVYKGVICILYEHTTYFVKVLEGLNIHVKNVCIVGFCSHTPSSEKQATIYWF